MARLRIVEPHVVTPCHQLKVLNPVIKRIVVDVVNHLGAFKRASQVLGHHVSVLKDVALATSHWVVGFVQASITLVGDYLTALPARILLSPQLRRVGSQAGQGVAKEMSFTSDRVFSKLCFFTTSALTQATRNLLRGGDVVGVQVGVRSDSRGVTSHESRLIVFTSFAGIGNLLTASTVTGFHNLIIAE